MDAWDYMAEVEFPSWSQTQREQYGFTFPACDPVKRIDFIFVRNATTAQSSSSSSFVEIVDTFVTGKLPTSQTGKLFLCFVDFGIII